MGKSRSLVTHAFCLALLTGLTASAASAQKNSITLGSTNSTSSHYAVAVAMSKAIKTGIPSANVSVIETGASVDNIRRLVRGEIELGLVAVDTGIQAIEGTGSFKEKAVKDLVAVYAYDVSILNIAVRADAGVANVKDLQGKKFNAGIRGSGAEMLTREAFSLLGIEPNWSSGTVQDAVEGIQNRQVVGYSKYGPGIGIDATLRELLTSSEMRLVGFDQAQQDKVLACVKGVDFKTLPENFIPGQKSITTPVVPIIYATRLGVMNDETAYAVAKAIYDNRQILIDTWPHLKDFNFKQQALRSEQLGIPLHPGAKRFWESLK
jgi:TRAP transporter TAXI family solute receptor